MLKKLAVALVAITSLIVVPAQAADLPSYPFIHVNAGASLHVTPDTGEIDFEIVSLEPDLEAAWKLVAERLEASRALLARHGVAVEDISVQDLLRRPLKQGDVVQAIETRAAVHATVRDLSGWTALIQALMTMPNVESLAVAFSRSDADKIEAELVGQALGAAPEGAEHRARHRRKTGTGQRRGAGAAEEPVERDGPGQRRPALYAGHGARRSALGDGAKAGAGGGRDLPHRKIGRPGRPGPMSSHCHEAAN